MIIRVCFLFRQRSGFLFNMNVGFNYTFVTVYTLIIQAWLYVLYHNNNNNNK
jgi:hypothetical protein